MTRPRFTIYPYQPTNDGAYHAPLPLVTCNELQDAHDYAERFSDADIVVSFEDKQVLIERRKNNAWCYLDLTD